jgi:hypothetical protein
MMPVEWPLAASAADRPVDPARPHAGHDRLPAVMTDFFLDEASRLTDEERSLMAAMLRSLVLEVGDELIAELPPLLGARTESLRDGLYRQLRNSGLLERPGIIALLLRRADEQQLSGHAHHGEPTLAALVGDEDGAVSEAAMALTLARGRRRDRFGRLGAEFDDVAAEDAVALVYAIAAALRHGLTEESEGALTDAARTVVARHDEGRRLEATVAAVARALEASGRGDDAMVATLAREGDSALLSGLLARRAGIGPDDAWRMFTGREVMMLARLAGCERAGAAQILAAFEPMSGAVDRFIDQFDGMDDAAIDRRRQWLRLDPHYRAGREAFGQSNG